MKPRLYLEIANTNFKRQAGLMHRRKLAENAGMLFSFDEEIPMSFWMQNTNIPLEIAFLDDNFCISEIKEMVPNSTMPVRSSQKCRYALEVNSGWFSKNKVKIGSSLKFSQFNNKEKKKPLEFPPKRDLPFIDDEEGQGDMQPPVDEFDQQDITNPEEDKLNIVPEETTDFNPDVIINMNIKEVVPICNHNKLAMVLDYEYPEGNVKPYILFPLEEFSVKTGATDGDLIAGPCVHSRGQFRNFIINNIVDFELYHTEGPNAGRRVEVPAPGALVMPPQSQEELVAASSDPLINIKCSFESLIKEAQSYSVGQLMMTEYWDNIKKKKSKGKSEGQAILEYLDENSKRNSPKKRKKKPSNKSKK